MVITRQVNQQRGQIAIDASAIVTRLISERYALENLLQQARQGVGDTCHAR